MNVATITMSIDKAKEKYAEYRKARSWQLVHGAGPLESDGFGAIRDEWPAGQELNT